MDEYEWKIWCDYENCWCWVDNTTINWHTGTDAEIDEDGEPYPVPTQCQNPNPARYRLIKRGSR
jgi:hypothetical protein